MVASRSGSGVSCLFVLLMGCEPGLAPEALTDDVLVSDGAGLVAPGCSQTRYVGWWLNGCPKPATGSAGGGHWSLRQTFPTAATVPDLREYCSYDWVPGTTPGAPDPTLLPAGASPDCHVVAALGDTLSALPAVATELQEVTLRMANALASLPSTPWARPLATRVAVVDTALPTGGGQPGTGRSKHGHGVGSLIRALACPQGGAGATPCAGWVSNHLALSQVSPTSEDPAQGGFFGSQERLAQAIVEAVQEWKALPTSGKFPRLVVNLSVGWDNQPAYGGAYPGGRSTQLPGPARAVHAAISYASCHGALVIAAAGNASGGPVPSSGATYPGAWESKAAPGPLECQRQFEYGVQTPGSRPVHSRSRYAPLVYAVGGVDGRDRPLANTRPGGRPRLAAYGYHVTSQVPGSVAADVMTGTSMSTALVSGIAATVWGYRPNLTAAEVMDIIYGSALPLSPTPVSELLSADVCLNDACAAQPIRRASLCTALQAACAHPGTERCPSSPLPCAGTVAPYAGAQPGWTEADWNEAVSTLPSQSLVMPDPCTGRGCKPVHTTRYTSVREPWVGPQPEDTGCDVCRIVGDTFYARLNSDFPVWNAASLSVRTVSDTLVFPLGAVLTPESREQTYIVEGLPFDSTELLEATVSFRTQDSTTIEPVLTP